jgi:hypothetical protein
VERALIDQLSSNGSQAARRRDVSRAGPILVALVGVVALAQAWVFGPDLQVDFGRELYLPWRVAQGDRLYVDVAHWSGPLSVAWHALLFTIFGESLAIVKLSNVAVLMAISFFVHALAVRFAGEIAAVVTTGFFVGALAFAQLLPLANYDYLTPYAHELTHGLVLALAGLHAMACLDRDRPRVPFVCGLLLAAVAATKVEVVVAYSAALVFGFGLPCLTDCAARRGKALADLGRLAAGLVLGLLLGTVLLAWHAGAGAALIGWTEPWRVLMTTDVSALPFYRYVMGTLDLTASLSRILRGGLFDLVALGGIAGLAVGWRRFGSERATPAVVVCVVLLPFLLQPPWMAVALAISPIFVIVALLFGASLVRDLQRIGVDHAARTAVLVFALVLAAKMALRAQLSHYGFVLYMPAALVCVACLVGLFPWQVEKRGGSRVLAVALGSSLVIAAGMGLQAKTTTQREARNAEFGEAGDAMRADARAREMSQALAYLEALPRDATVAVLPEGIMLNYLARRVNPTPYINFMPPELEMYGEATIVDAFRASPPDVVVYVHKRAGLYGTPFFGRDYGRSLYGFVQANYRPAETWGGAPFDPGTRFGVRVLERVGAAPPSVP